MELQAIPEKGDRSHFAEKRVTPVTLGFFAGHAGPIGPDASFCARRIDSQQITIRASRKTVFVQRHAPRDGQKQGRRSGNAGRVALGGQRALRGLRHMARKHSKHGSFADIDRHEEEAPAAAPPCWLCSRPAGKTMVWHHPVPKSRGGRNVVPMHPICQQALIANFTNSELERHGMDVEALRADPTVSKFIAWVAKKDPDFNASTAKKKR